MIDEVRMAMQLCGITTLSQASPRLLNMRQLSSMVDLGEWSKL